MADEKKNGNGKMAGGSCGCGGCNCVAGGGMGMGGYAHGRHWTFFLLRTLLMVLLLIIVFWFGVVAGRVGMGSYSRTMMMRGYGMGMYGGAGSAMPMMGATTTPTANY